MNVMTDNPATVAYILMKHPSLSQTFLRREIAELTRQGLRIEVHSLWRVQLDAPSPELTVCYFRWWEAFGLVVALPHELWRDPALLRDGWRMLRRNHFTTPMDFLKNLWGAIFAVCRAQTFRQSRVQLIHGAWATSPATAAAVLGRLCGVPFSFGAQAYDIYEHGGDQFLNAKLRAASFVHTTTEANVAYLHERVPEANIVLARRGLDRLPTLTDKARTPGPIRILSVGRLTSIKGHHLQLAACAQLKQWGVPFASRIIGDGELRRSLEQRIAALSLRDVVTLCGGQPHEQVEEAYRWADIFWHTGVIDESGNRDGLPNVILEAFAHRLPVICGPVRGATEAVTHDVTGLVVDVTNPVALGGAVKRLADDESLRRRLGENGRRWVEENFVVSKNAAILAEAFRQAVRS